MPTKIRVMPTLLFKDVGLVKGIRFDSSRRIGSAMQAVKVYNLREVDELVLLDIAATRAGRLPDFEMVDELADECFMPLTVGGGVRTVDDVRRLLQVGADKVALNTAAVDSPELIRDLANLFGSQCVVVSIDVHRAKDGRYEIVTRSGTNPVAIDPIAFGARMAASGAGELLVTSIDRDGTMSGYDIELIRQMAAAVSIPVIASGGAGSYEHMEQVLREGAAAVAAASIFHFTEHTPLGAKRYLAERGVAVRL